MVTVMSWLVRGHLLITASLKGMSYFPKVNLFVIFLHLFYALQKSTSVPCITKSLTVMYKGGAVHKQKYPAVRSSGLVSVN